MRLTVSGWAAARELKSSWPVVMIWRSPGPVPMKADASQLSKVCRSLPFTLLSSRLRLSSAVPMGVGRTMREAGMTLPACR